MGAALLARPSCLLTAPSLSLLTVLLCSVFQAFPLEPLCCRRGRPGPFRVSTSGRGHALYGQGAPSALPLGHGGGWGPSPAQLESPWLRHPAKGSECGQRWGGCSVQIAETQLTVAGAQCGSDFVTRSRLLHS